EFINATKRPFPSELELVDFKEKMEETRQQINKSVSELTDGKMENILNEGSINDQTKILLVNTAYFVTNWMKKFPEAQIKECPFKINKTETKPVQMMNLEATFCLGYVKELKTAILELPCLNKHMSMLILLPKEIEDDTTGLEQLEQALTPETLVQWTNPSVMANTKVNVFLPKFKVEGDYDLKPVLESLGMTDIFNENVADFSEMSETKGVVLSQIIHRVSLEVNEEAHRDFTMGSISQAITEMGLDLYKELNKNAANKNIFISPMSISTGLVMVLLGARGNTATQMQTALHLNRAARSANLETGPVSESGTTEAEPEYLNEGQYHQLPHFPKPSPSRCDLVGGIHTEFQTLLSQLKNLNKSYVLSLANSLFAQKGYNFHQQYLECTKELYGTMLQTVDFENATEAARQTINSWVESKTQGKIRELFVPGVIDPTAVLVLVNAIYFKATWEYKFEEKYTMPKDFRINQNESKSVQMMYQKDRFKIAHIQEMNAQILMIPYAGKSLSMMILLPDDITGLEQLFIFTMSSISEATTNFCLDFFKVLNEDHPSENIIYSPLSISAALAMVLLGARGNTATQIQKVPDDQCDIPGGIHSQFHDIFSAINKPTASYELAIANRLYGEKTFSFLQKYLSCIQKLYQAELEPADFQNAAEETREQINLWVETFTNGKIKDLFAPGTLSAQTTLVLVNAVYFKGKWEVEFKKENTEERPFQINETTSKPVQMMYQKGKYKIAAIEEHDCQVLELPYKGGDLSMYILLPKDYTGLTQLEKELTYEKLTTWISPYYMKEDDVEVSLPQFKIETSTQLNQYLKALGITDVFSHESDLSGIAEAGDLSVSAAVHKAYIEVNEEGTEAAAATGIGIGVTSVGRRIEFVADHPFLFFIRHQKTESILFFGRFSSPQENF
ncbi:hypothetical protein KIL84_010312, partial [Mauremys mutica]